MPRGRRLLAALIWALPACTASNPDYMMDGPCAAGSRQCVESTRRGSYPVVCGKNPDGQLALLDERCPVLAACKDGLCRPPQGAKTCVRQGDCGKGEVCVPLVSGDNARALGLYCLTAAAAPASAAPGQHCERDEDCQSYLCLPYRTGNFCLKACKETQDCTIPDECRALNVTLTGVSGSIQSCSQR